MVLKAYIDVNDFKTTTGIDLNDSITIENALNFGFSMIKKLIYIEIIDEYKGANTEFKLETPIADVSADLDVDTDDIEVYEFDKTDYASPETDRSSNISSFIPKYGFLVMDTSLPTSGKSFRIKYYKSKYRLEDIKEELKRLNVLFAVNYLFENTSFDKLQNGISSWNLNGVSITFDQNTMKQIIDDNKSKINALVNYLKPYYSRKTDIGFGQNDYPSRFYQSFGRI
jgi:hypothetical protein